MSKRMCKKLGTWFECSAKFMDSFDGTTKKRKVCVEAISFAEAENTAISYLLDAYGLQSSDVKITSISIASYTEVYFREKCGDWFKASMKSLGGDKDVILLSAENIEDAHSTLDNEIIGAEQHWFITKLEQTDMIEVVSYEATNFEDDAE